MSQPPNDAERHATPEGLGYSYVTLERAEA